MRATSFVMYQMPVCCIKWIWKATELVRRGFCLSVRIDADEREVISAAFRQNFVPIMDSKHTPCGILTRRGMIAHPEEKNGIPRKV